MTAEKFDLFMGCLGNGITVCNRAVEVNGDYKHVAHISEAGNIKYYVSRSYIPDADRQRIEQTAARMRSEYESDLDRDIENHPAYIYGRMLDCLTTAELLDHIGPGGRGLQESIAALREIYLERN